jgi:DNA (cytosine-5)-methyltransferase 1
MPKGNQPIRVFDFFSGCGGTSCGFQTAGLDIVWALDIDADSAATFRQNFPKSEFLQADIRSVDPIVLEPLMNRSDSPIVFSGCAPCQPFSRQNNHKKGLDPRRSLLSEFARFISHWLPDYVFVENVPGLQKIDGSRGHFSDFLNLLNHLGYRSDFGVVPALWFGVPQTRERLILLASKHSTIKLPQPTHGPGSLPFSTVRNWLNGLPALRAGERNANDPDHQAASLSELNLKRIGATPEGGGRESWPSELWLDCHRNHKGHSDVYGRMRWDRPASGLTTRCISYSNGRFGHPQQMRAISVREAGCLQTFPRTFRWQGTLSSKARQIGNAVPPLMARRVAEAILLQSQA